jgi:glycosyltransferase involved in cell wall biosynthesis
VVSYIFPPAGGGGVQRTAKFVKYLQAFGWRPHVLAPLKSLVGCEDPGLLAELPPDLPVERTFCLEPEVFDDSFSFSHFSLRGLGHKMVRNLFRLLDGLALPDEQAGWLPFAVGRGIRAVGREKIEVVFATGPPFSSLIAGWGISRLSGRPLVLDFRDEWIPTFQNYLRKSPFRRSLERMMEKTVVRDAARVISVTGRITERFHERYGGSPEKFVTITNGFDAEDFPEAVPMPDGDVFRIAHTGILYRNRSPAPFLEAVQKVVSSERWKGRLKVVLAGQTENIPEIERLGLGEVVETPGYLPHRECVSLLRDSHLLLLMIDRIPASGFVYTGKIFEYLAAARPVLALTEEDSLAARLLSDFSCGTIVPFEDADKIARAIMNAMELWDKGRLAAPARSPELSRFERKNLARDLGALLEEAAQGRPR